MINDEFDQVVTVRRDYPGWAVILDDLVRRLNELDVDIEVRQVKEKFGTLRFYFELPEGTDENTRHEVHDIVGTAEVRTSIVCAMCAAPRTKEGTGYWVLYFCDQHDTRDLKRYWRENE